MRMEFIVENATLRVGRTDLASSGPSMAMLGGMQGMRMLMDGAEPVPEWNPDPRFVHEGDYLCEIAFSFDATDFLNAAVFETKRMFWVAMVREGPLVGDKARLWPEFVVARTFSPGSSDPTIIMLTDTHSGQMRLYAFPEVSGRVRFRRAGPVLELYVWNSETTSWSLPDAYENGEGGTLTPARLTLSAGATWAPVVPMALAMTAPDEPLAPVAELSITHWSLVADAGEAIEPETPAPTEPVAYPFVEDFSDEAWG
jgi:hypothetical protein